MSTELHRLSLKLLACMLRCRRSFLSCHGIIVDRQAGAVAYRANIFRCACVLLLVNVMSNTTLCEVLVFFVLNTSSTDLPLTSYCADQEGGGEGTCEQQQRRSSYFLVKNPASVLCPLDFPVAGFAAGFGNALPLPPASAPPALDDEPLGPKEDEEAPMEGFRSSVSVTLDARDDVPDWPMFDLRPFAAGFPRVATGSSSSPSEHETSSTMVLVTFASAISQQVRY